MKVFNKRIPTRLLSLDVFNNFDAFYLSILGEVKLELFLCNLVV
jgi:hypothetical protein